MNTMLWFLQGTLAAVFLASGSTKSWMAEDRLVAMGQTGVGPLPMPLVRLGAILEIPGAVGVLLPWATGILPVLTPLAAVGFAIIMAVAIPSHIYLWRRGVGARRVREKINVVGTSAIFLASVTVAIARFAQLSA